MQEWVIFGSGHYLGEIFDLIHINNGKVKSIINNVEKSLDEKACLQKHIASLNYDINLFHIDQFKPHPNDKYTFGFMNNRKMLIEYLKKTYQIIFSSLIHPSAQIGSHIKMGEGTIIAPSVVLASHVEIQDFCIINRSSSIGHDTILEKYCTIGPGVHIGGNSVLREQVKIGIGATIINQIQIGHNATIGAGAVVVSDIKNGVLAMGVPAREIKSLEDTLI